MIDIISSEQLKQKSMKTIFTTIILLLSQSSISQSITEGTPVYEGISITENKVKRSESCCCIITPKYNNINIDSLFSDIQRIKKEMKDLDTITLVDNACKKQGELIQDCLNNLIDIIMFCETKSKTDDMTITLKRVDTELIYLKDLFCVHPKMMHYLDGTLGYSHMIQKEIAERIKKENLVKNQKKLHAK